MPTRKDDIEYIRNIQKVCDDEGAILEDQGRTKGGHRLLLISVGKHTRKMFLPSTSSCWRGRKKNKGIALRLINEMRNAT